MRPPAWIVLLGLATAQACGGDPAGPATPSVATVVVSPPTLSLSAGATSPLGAVARDSRGAVVAGQTITWTTTSATVATVSAGGVVTAVSEGQADVRATIGGVTGSARVTVSGLPNLAVSHVWLTQGTQRPDGSIPLVVGGRPVLVNVAGTLTNPFSTVPQVTVRAYQGAVLIYENTAPMTGLPGPVLDEGRPVHQVVMPAAIVVPDLRIAVTANAGGAVAELRLDDNQWPATGNPVAIPVRTVQAFEIHVVPIRLTADGTVGAVTPANLEEYLLATRQMFPWAQLTGTIGAVFSTDVPFGGGQPGAWTQILPQLDMLRVIEGTSRYYVGSVRPAPGVTFVQNGGWGYIPGNPASIGPGTRSSLVVGVGWFNRARATTELVAHELGHNHGRLHVPCGSPSNPDPLYPHGGGSIGVWTHDLYSFGAGPATSVAALGPATGRDLMSYCTPVWTSDYTYLGLLNVRSTPAAAVPGAPCDCRLIGGTISPEGVVVAPVFETAAHVALPDPRGAHRLEGLDAEGRVLFAYSLAPTPVDHAPGVSQFLVALPREWTGGDALATIRVRDAAGRVGTAPQGAGVPATIAARRAGGGLVELTWDIRQAPGILVRDPVTHRVLGVGRSGRLTVRSADATVEVIASRGARSSRARLAVQ